MKSFFLKKILINNTYIKTLIIVSFIDSNSLLFTFYSNNPYYNSFISYNISLLSPYINYYMVIANIGLKPFFIVKKVITYTKVKKNKVIG